MLFLYDHLLKQEEEMEKPTEKRLRFSGTLLNKQNGYTKQVQLKIYRHLLDSLGC